MTNFSFLTLEERNFLERHGIGLDSLFDARGLSVADRRARAKAADCAFIVGEPCREAGHRLRTRYGHCIQCNVACITFQRRNAKSGYVYIAGSLKARMVKVGGCTNLADRQEQLRTTAYAGFDDWKLLRRVKADEYGRFEGEVHRRLERWSIEIPYRKDGREQIAREVFACAYSIASAALEQAAVELGVPVPPGGVDPDCCKYEFPAQPQLPF